MQRPETSSASEQPQRKAAADWGAVSARLEGLVDWERRKRASMRVSTDPARALLAALGEPQRGLRVVHVTGSKGKGSTSALVAAGLARAGLRVGRYASPHVERLNERVVIDGVEVADELLYGSLARALDAREALIRERPEVDPTWFDVMTAAALVCFRAAGVEWVVAEVGLGGRLDSTNVLDGEVCVITNIELEHTAVLGDTHFAIATEKAGILKLGCTLVTGVPAGSEADRAIAARAAELGVAVRRPLSAPVEPDTVAERNRRVAVAVLDELGTRGVVGRAGERLSGGLLDPATALRAALPGRQERFRVGSVPVVLDGAHTPASVAAALSDLARDPALRVRPVVVLGLARDKDQAGILKHLAPEAEKLVSTSVGTELHRTAAEIAEAAAAVGVMAESATPPRAALELALEHARSRGAWVLVIGSLYLAGALRPDLRQAAT
jgi:dihydrofolate synthase/folylpolyglutamate synthase